MAVCVLCLFLTVPWVGLQSLIVAFSGHTHLGKQIQTSLRLISVALSNVLYCIYDVSVVS